MSNELETKIIAYLEKLKKSPSNSEISSKKRSLLLVKKQEYQNLDQTQKEYQALISESNNEEDKKIFKAEIENLTTQKNQIINKIKNQLIEEEAVKQNIVMEIRPGTGGDEAGIFAHDLYCMYSKFAKKKGWKIEMVERKTDYKGRAILVSFLIKGENVFNWLKKEAGVHRVQRVPETESKGRVHTSTATVVVLPEAEEIALKINPKDLKIETYGPGGPGGQHANKTASAVRITHLPTGTISASQDGRDQRVNRERALFVLKTRLLEKLQAEKDQKIGNLRSTTIGSAERSEKIRTYNFPDNRVTDHRLKISWKKLDFILEGELEEICQKLVDYEIEKKITEEK